MEIEKLRKLAFAGNIGAIGFILGITLNMALEGHLTIPVGIIFGLLILANVFAAKSQW